MKTFSKSISFLGAIFFTLMLIPQTASAQNNVYKEWPSKSNIAPNKKWTIKFNSKLNPSTITSKNIVVTDNQNKSVNVGINLSEDKKSVTVAAPSSGYISGETYTLNIGNEVSQENGKALSKPIKMPFTIIKKSEELTKTIDNVTVKIRKVEQDTDSLKVYVTYINNSNKEILTGDCLSKIVFNKKQYAYDEDFNFKRYYEKDIKAPDSIEPNVSADSVIFFKPIPNVSKINMVLSSNLQEYRFNDIEVNDMAKGQLNVDEEKKETHIASLTKNGNTILINKVVQDNDSLKMYVTYINNSNKELLTNDCLAKITHNGNQYEYDSDFNLERYYDKNVSKAQDSIEPTVHEKSVIFFKPINNVDKINIVLNLGLEDYNFNDIIVEKE